MDNPCNVGQAQQKTLIPKTLPIACKPTYPYELVNSQSESDDIDRVVEYIRKLRGTSKVNLLGWSGGGIRSGTYTQPLSGKGREAGDPGLVELFAQES